MVGYSGTQLAKKLGIKTGFTVWVVNAPANYKSLLVDLPDEVKFISSPPSSLVDMVHLFGREYSTLPSHLQKAMEAIPKSGVIWVSWPKKAAKVTTDIDENKIRELALSMGLVDVKVCAVDDTWSGLKLVYRLKDR
jgi:hypothetical protein